MYRMKIYTHCSAEVSSDPIPLTIDTVTVHDAAKVKAVTIIVEQRTWLKLLGQAHQFGGKLLWFHSYKSFHKYNFHKWLRNYEKYRNFLLQKFGAIRYFTLKDVSTEDTPLKFNMFIE